MSSADELKAQGNAAFSAGRFDEAAERFSAAIAVDPTNHVLYSNRSASYASLNRFAEALTDAEKVTEIKPDWPKGFSRVGAALHGLRRWDEAVSAYEKGLALDPSNALLKQGLEDAKKAKQSSSMPMGGGPFTQPEVLSRLASDPRTRNLMGQPDFMSMLQTVNSNPNLMQQYFGDERFQLALEVGLGLKMSGGDDMPMGGAGAGRAAAAAAGGGAQDSSDDDEAPPLEDTDDEDDDDDDDAPPLEDADDDEEDVPAAAAAAAAPPQQQQSEEDKAKEAAYLEKEAGNEAYKKKDFESAISHYNKAIELFDGDISFITNRAAVKFEQGDFEGCIADCDAAVDRGRELRADYKLVARAMTRRGNAQVKLGDLEGAIATYNRSLTEHRNADTLKRVQEAEKALKDKQEQEYIDMDTSAVEKEAGNAAFKEQKYPEAVKHYTEALKRGPPSVNPEAHKLYSNRAACYTKLAAFNEGLKDAEECIRLAPDFTKGYSRKGHLQFFMKEYEKAMETYRAGLERDPENAELKEGLMRCIEAINRTARGDVSEDELQQRRDRGMADPEVQSILSDPVMRQVIRDLQEDPAAAQKHLSHPEVSKKLDKLISAGIIQIK